MCSEKKVRPIDKVPCHDGTTLKFVSRKFTEEDEKMINDFLSWSVKEIERNIEEGLSCAAKKK